MRSDSAHVQELPTEDFAMCESLLERPLLVAPRVVTRSEGPRHMAVSATVVARAAVGADGDGAAVLASLSAPAAVLVALTASFAVPADDIVATDIAVEFVALLFDQILDLFVVHRAHQHLAVPQ